MKLILAPAYVNSEPYKRIANLEFHYFGSLEAFWAFRNGEFD